MDNFNFKNHIVKFSQIQVHIALGIVFYPAELTHLGLESSIVKIMV